MTKSWDVAVVGLGAMGSAVTCQLASRGQRVVAFDIAEPPHLLGSTHGESRVIREAYFEHPFYVPLVQRSYELWQALQRDSERTLLHETGGLLIGPRNGALIGGTRLSADRHGLDYDMLTAGELRRRFPVFDPTDDLLALLEPRAGILLPEVCVQACLELGVKHDAAIHANEPVTEWKPTGDGVRVVTERGTYDAGRLILTPGPWMSMFVPDLRLPLTVERQVLHWFEPAASPGAFALGTLPVYAWEYESGSLFYGFPDLGNGVKVAFHHQGVVTDIESMDRSVAPEEINGMRALLTVCMPAVVGEHLRSETCVYTNTPDEHFLIDTHPGLDQVLIVSPCSGHGFKFAAVVGEIVADLITRGSTDLDISPFRLDRFKEAS